MDKFIIKGEAKLSGEVSISGSKNAALPILAATLLSSEDCFIENVPDLMDIRTMLKILKVLGRDIERLEDGTVVSRPKDESPIIAPYDLVKTMRASIATLGPLVAKRGKAKVSLPGGCVIGSRPVDLHVKGLEALGAKIHFAHGYILAETEQLRGNDIYLGGTFGPSVLATANVLMAATLANGTTIIDNAASEPEVSDLANFINTIGGAIKGTGSHRLEIRGVKSLGGGRYRVIPDRIEAGTFMCAAAMTQSEIKIRNVDLSHLSAVVHMLRESGVIIEKTGDGCVVAANEPPKASVITTQPYPGFPTDMQAQFMAMLAVGQGVSIFTEKIFPDRFMHVGELNRMGAQVFREADKAIVTGVPKLSGAEVMASDLRASAAMVLAGLVAEGETIVERVYHIDRGYEKIEEKFNALGADIRRINEKYDGTIPDFSHGE